MGMMFGNVQSGRRSYPIYNNSGARVGTVSVTRGNKKSDKSNKRLQYRYKEISALILRAKTSGNAGQAVLKARAKAASLRQKLRTGEYDDQELQEAIVHADKMVRIAKKRQKHLKQEENAKRLGALEDKLEQEEKMEEGLEEDVQAALENALDSEDGLSFHEEDLREYKKELKKQMQEMMKEYQEQMQEEMQDLMQEAGKEDGLQELLEELGQMDQVSMKSKDLEELKRKHRQEELRDIIKADMEYLKAFFGRLEKEKQEASSGGASSSGGISLELGGMEMPVETQQMPPVTLEGVSIDTVV